VAWCLYFSACPSHDILTIFWVDTAWTPFDNGGISYQDRIQGGQHEIVIQKASRSGVWARKSHSTHSLQKPNLSTSLCSQRHADSINKLTDREINYAADVLLCIMSITCCSYLSIRHIQCFRLWGRSLHALAPVFTANFQGHEVMNSDSQTPNGATTKRSPHYKWGTERTDFRPTITTMLKKTHQHKEEEWRVCFNQHQRDHLLTAYCCPFQWLHTQVASLLSKHFPGRWIERNSSQFQPLAQIRRKWTPRNYEDWIQTLPPSTGGSNPARPTLPLRLWERTACLVTKGKLFTVHINKENRFLVGSKHLIS